MRYMLTDDLWAALRPLGRQARRNNQGPKPKVPDRAFIEALLYLARTSVPWRDLPAEFGRWKAIYNHFRRWVASGGRARRFEAMTADPVFGDTRRVLIDSTSVRPHQHAAGARLARDVNPNIPRRANRAPDKCSGPTAGIVVSHQNVNI